MIPAYNNSRRNYSYGRKGYDSQFRKNYSARNDPEYQQQEKEKKARFLQEEQSQRAQELLSNQNMTTTMKIFNNIWENCFRLATVGGFPIGYALSPSNDNPLICIDYDKWNNIWNQTKNFGQFVYSVQDPKGEKIRPFTWGYRFMDPSSCIKSNYELGVWVLGFLIGTIFEPMKIIHGDAAKELISSHVNNVIARFTYPSNIMNILIEANQNAVRMHQKDPNFNLNSVSVGALLESESWTDFVQNIPPDVIDQIKGEIHHYKECINSLSNKLKEETIPPLTDDEYITLGRCVYIGKGITPYKLIMTFKAHSSNPEILGSQYGFINALTCYNHYIVPDFDEKLMDEESITASQQQQNQQQNNLIESGLSAPRIIQQQQQLPNQHILSTQIPSKTDKQSFGKWNNQF